MGEMISMIAHQWMPLIFKRQLTLKKRLIIKNLKNQCKTFQAKYNIFQTQLMILETFLSLIKLKYRLIYLML